MYTHDRSKFREKSMCFESVYKHKCMRFITERVLFEDDMLAIWKKVVYFSDWQECEILEILPFLSEHLFMFCFVFFNNLYCFHANKVQNCCKCT